MIIYQEVEAKHHYYFNVLFDKRDTTQIFKKMVLVKLQKQDIKKAKDKVRSYYSKSAVLHLCDLDLYQKALV